MTQTEPRCRSASQKPNSIAGTGMIAHGSVKSADGAATPDTRITIAAPHPPTASTRYSMPPSPATRALASFSLAPAASSAYFAERGPDPGKAGHVCQADPSG